MTTTTHTATPTRIPVTAPGWMRWYFRAPDQTIKLEPGARIEWDLKALLRGDRKKDVRFFFWDPVPGTNPEVPGPFGTWTESVTIDEHQTTFSLTVPNTVLRALNEQAHPPQNGWSFRYLISALDDDHFVIGENSPPKIILDP